MSDKTGRESRAVPTILDVPYRQKDEAKALGARWNPELRTWYVPAGVSAERFARWLPQAGRAGVRLKAPIYAVEARTQCWSCGDLTPVVALGVEALDESPTEVERAQHDASREASESSEDREGLLVLSGIEELPRDLQELLARRYPFLKKRYSKTAQCRYFMNHCHCGAPLGDFFLHSEPGASFCPTSREEAAQIVLRALPVSGTRVVRAGVGQQFPDLIGIHAKREPFSP
jgi:uncharacterized protein DUF5710